MAILLGHRMSAVVGGFRCPLCGSTAATPVRVLQDEMFRTTTAAFSLVRCARCGLLRLHPPPDAETLAAAYGVDYAPHVRPGLSGWAKGRLERRSVRQLWEVFGPPRRVVDLGCATGDLLVGVREAGNPNVLGIEPGADAAQIARGRGLEIVAGMLEDARLPDASVDTLVMSHTLEHVADPAATLLEARRVLRDGGALVLWLPNADSIEARLLGRYWIGYDAPRHLTTFSTRTLRRALTSAGFGRAVVRHEAVGLEWAWALRLWLRGRWPVLERGLRPLHPLLIVLATPLALLGAVSGKSGRIRVVAVVDSEGRRR